MCFQNHNWYVYQQNKLDRPDLRSSIMIYIHILLFAFLLSSISFPWYIRNGTQLLPTNRHLMAARTQAFLQQCFMVQAK